MASYKVPPAPTFTLNIDQNEEKSMYKVSRENAAKLLTKVLHDLEGWKFIAQKNNVKFFKKRSNDGKSYSINAITKIQASLDEVMDSLYCPTTSAFASLMMQLHDDKFGDGSVLSDLTPRTDKSGAFREKCGVKWVMFKPFASVGKARDYTIVDYCAVRSSSSAKGTENGTGKGAVDDRIGIQVMFSVKRPECKDYEDEFGVERSVLQPSGFVVYPSGSSDKVEVIFCWSCEDKRVMKKGYKKSILSIVQSICKLERTIVTLRISKSGFIKPKNWVLDKNRKNCKVCKESFGPFRRKHHCRICGDIACSKCSSVTTANLPTVGMSNIRICTTCLQDKMREQKLLGEDESQSSQSVKVEKNKSRPVRTPPPAPAQAVRSGSDSRQLESRDTSATLSRASPQSERTPATRNSKSLFINEKKSKNTPASNRFDSDSESEDEDTFMGQNVPHLEIEETIAEDFEEMDSIKADPHEISANLVSKPVLVRPFQYELDFTWNNKWPKSPYPSDELPRQRKVHSLDILACPVIDDFDKVIQCAIETFGCNIAYISFLDHDTEWIKGSRGLQVNAVRRDSSFVAHAIMSYDVSIVLDTRMDVRFKDNPAVCGPPFIRFYTAFPLISSDGYIVGAIQVADTIPRKRVETGQVAVLSKLANHTMSYVEEFRQDSIATISSDKRSSSSIYGVAQPNPAQMEMALASLLQKSHETNEAVKQTGNMMRYDIQEIL